MIVQRIDQILLTPDAAAAQMQKAVDDYKAANKK
jgi:hypothetical protein